jgi:NAD(P)-dependent dehydrogenase (short-subunit alcohol dehydrogenase family)
MCAARRHCARCSTIGLRSVPTNFDGGYDGYGAAKVAVISLMRSYAGRLAPRSIRVNTVHPTGVATGMVQNGFFPEFVRQHEFLQPTLGNPMPVGVIEPDDVSRAILYLVSDDGRYVTGQTLAVDGGKTSVVTGKEL